jgi:hypothetical protein
MRLQLAAMQLPESPVDKMAEVREDVALKLSLWTSSAEFEALTTAWRAAQFEAMDVPAMEEIVDR